MAERQTGERLSPGKRTWGGGHVGCGYEQSLSPVPTATRLRAITQAEEALCQVQLAHGYESGVDSDKEMAERKSAEGRSREGGLENSRTRHVRRECDESTSAMPTMTCVFANAPSSRGDVQTAMCCYACESRVGGDQKKQREKVPKESFREEEFKKSLCQVRMRRAVHTSASGVCMML